MTQVLSLAELPEDTRECVADVCIVGAGAAGLLLLYRLRAAGLRVVVLDAGPRAPVGADAADMLPQFGDAPYCGATEGRAFGLGGTTARWGGQLIGFPAQDAMRADAAHAAAWSRVVAATQRHGEAVLRLLDVGAAEAFPAPGAGALAQAGLQTLGSSWMPFRRRNLAWLASAASGRGTDVGLVVCDATVAGWTLEGGAAGPGRVTAMVARSATGRTLTVRATHVVIAAGAIESTRIVLEVHRIGGDHVLPRDAEAGLGLSDHLSTTIAEVEPQARARMADAFAPRFRQGTMRSLRWIVAAPAPDAPRAFAHPVFALDAPGFVFARAMLRDLQARRLPRPGMREFARGIGGVARLGWERYANTRLHVPADAPSHLQMDMEQRPHPCNRIRLGDARDRHGRLVAAIDWRIRDADRDDLATAAAGLLARWRSAGDAVPPLRAVAVDAMVAKPHDAYHPVGSCRMGGDAGAVVDLGLRLRGLDNVRVLSTAVLPSAGSANPTFALLCLAEEVAAALQAQLRGALGAVA